MECRSRLHTTGPDLRREKSSFSLLFFPLFFPWPAETDVTIGFGIAAHIQGIERRRRMWWRAVQRQNQRRVEGGGLCRSQCVCQFCVGVSFERMWNDCSRDSSPEWRMKGMKRYGASHAGWRTGEGRLERDGWHEAHRGETSRNHRQGRAPPSDGARSRMRAHCVQSCKFLATTLLWVVNKVSHFSYLFSWVKEPWRRQIRVSV